MATPKPASARDVVAPWLNPDAKPLIRLRGLTKRFGDFTAVDEVDLDIYPKEFFSLLGPSGCGKTTIMRMLAGFETPSGGEIVLDGQNIAGVPPNRRPVNMMFQSYALFPHLTVEDNIAFGLRREGMPKDQIMARVSEMLRLVQLQKFASRKPHQISGGQRQRVALARSLAKAPMLLLLDEPLGALDKKLRTQTQFELMDIQEKTGTTFVIVTHDQEEAMTVSSRVAVMDQGRIIQVATPAAIYENPGSRYVAEFIGDVNLIEGKAGKTVDGTLALHWTEGLPPLQIECADPPPEGAEVCLAIRPEKVEIFHERPPHANAVHGKVLDIAYLGSTTTYHVELPDGQVLKALVANARKEDAQAYTWEDPCWLGWTPRRGVVLTA
jgi:putrescine transport system ATP-binding protein